MTPEEFLACHLASNGRIQNRIEKEIGAFI